MCCNSRHNNRPWIICLLIVLLTILFGLFIYVFHKQQLSSNITDWGSFGSYVGGTVSIISLFLLYFTYNNQVNANRKSQFETILFQMSCNFKDRCSERTEEWEKAYEDIGKYYIVGDLVDAKLITKKNVINAIKSSFHNSILDTYLNGQLDVFCDIINYIGREESLDEEGKKIYYTFFSSQMNNEMLIIIMLGLIARDNRREIEFLKNADFFKNVDMGGNVALNRIRQLYFSINANEVYKNPIDDVLDNLRPNTEKFPETFMDYYSKIIAKDN